MTLYVWNGDSVLENYRTGHCIVMANSLEQARSMAKDRIIEMYSYLLSPESYWDEDDTQLVNDKTSFLENEPLAYTQPIVFAIEGSE